MKCIALFLAVAAFACGGDDDGDDGAPAADSAPDESADAGDQGRTVYESLSAGENHTCDLVPGTGAACWGEGASGLLGDGDDGNSNVPVEVAGDHRWKQVSAGRLHTCALDSDGAAWCWGSNSGGQGGSGAIEGPFLEPNPVAGDLVFTQISSGYEHTCAIAEDGAAYCWGQNGSGELGTDIENDLEVEPTAVAGGLRFAHISAGAAVTCGVTTAGDGYCWGSDTYGQIGDGGAISGQSTDIRRAPVEIAGGHSWRMVIGGQQSTCGLTDQGVGHCWGRNGAGRLGDGGDADSSSPVPLAGDHELVDIDMGGTHGCGIDTEGAAWCWGANNSGELGVAEPIDLSRDPVAVSGGLVFAEVEASISGGAHTCGITLDRSAVHCWGRGQVGQLGHGSDTDFSERTHTPQPVTGQP